MAPDTKREPNLVGQSSGVSAQRTSLPRSVSAQDDDKKPVVVIDTSMGKITIELDQGEAPITVANFLKYVDDGFLRQPDLSSGHSQIHDPGRRVRRQSCGKKPKGRERQSRMSPATV